MPFEQKRLEPLDAVVNVRLTQGEKAELVEQADLAGMSVSQYVRARIFNRPVLANADQVTIKELRRLGGLLKAVHLESNGAYSRDTANAIAVLTNYMNQLATGLHHDR